MRGDEGALRAHLAECLLPCGSAAPDSVVEGVSSEAAAAAAAAEPGPVAVPVLAASPTLSLPRPTSSRGRRLGLIG
ncbi:hypothetical protein OC834_006623, partial [Tilletia horrida]